MGTSESKMAVATTPKPDVIHRLKSQRIAALMDPRSPSCGIDRTPIQVNGVASSACDGQESGGPVFLDPRSPTVGVTRTPLKDSLKVTVSSLARQLSTFFLGDVTAADSASTLLPFVSFKKHSSSSSVDQQVDLSSKEPLLPPDSFSTPSVCPSTPRLCSSSMGYGSFSNSPFVIVGEAQVEQDVDTTLEEGDEALLLDGSPLDKELSLSLLACREGIYSPVYLPSAEERPSTPVPPAEHDQDADHADSHPCAQLASPVLEAKEPSPEQKSIMEVPEPLEKDPGMSETPNPEPVDTSNKTELAKPAKVFPKFDTCSPSQVVFKPQWLGVGFGTSGVRARGLQSHGKAPSLPLSTSKAPKDENENKVVLTMQKQKGKSLSGEVRSPLQTLKESNSPRNAQMRLKASTTEKQRFGQMDRRLLVLSLDKEN